MAKGLLLDSAFESHVHAKGNIRRVPEANEKVVLWEKPSVMCRRIHAHDPATRYIFSMIGYKFREYAHVLGDPR